MTSPNLKIYPSRMFVRFIAYKQLLADVTGQPTVLTAQRRGRPPFFREFTPANPFVLTFTELFDFPEESGSCSSTTYQDFASEENQCDRASWDSFRKVENGTNHSQFTNIDETLLEEVFQTSIQPKRRPELYLACETADLATQLEVNVACEIVATYWQVKQNQASPDIQKLNSLL